MERARIQILIPTCNDVDRIERTLESIWNQNYEKEDIYIEVMDFGSTDGTYEKLLAYDSYHLGIYQNTKTQNRRQMIGEMAKILKFTHPGGHYSFQIVLYPGEILYPNCLMKCSQALIENQFQKPAFVITEADIIKKDGSIRKQKPVFSEDTKIDGNCELRKYVETEYQHNIFGMRYGFATDLYRAAGECNEFRWWNKLARMANEQVILYINEPLAAVNEIFYEDELEEILLRWESIIIQTRIYESKFGRSFDDKFEKAGKKNLAEYALWRSYLLYLDNKKREAEDCFYISAVIDNEIMETDLYSKVEKLVIENDYSVLEYLKEQFE